MATFLRPQGYQRDPQRDPFYAGPLSHFVGSGDSPCAEIFLSGRFYALDFNGRSSLLRGLEVRVHKETVLEVRAESSKLSGGPVLPRSW